MGNREERSSLTCSRKQHTDLIKLDEFNVKVLEERCYSLIQQGNRRLILDGPQDLILDRPGAETARSPDYWP